MANTNQSHDNHEQHITPLSTYLKVAGALFALTVLTVAAHAIHETLGALAPIVAFGIAGVKAFLVMYYFMHLKYESKENRLIFTTAFCCLILLFAIALIDILSRMNVISFA